MMMMLMMLVASLLLLLCVLLPAVSGFSRHPVRSHIKSFEYQETFSRSMKSINVSGRKRGDLDFEDVLEDFNDEKENNENTKKRQSAERYPGVNDKGKDSKRPLIFNMKSKWKALNKGILAGIFVAGIGAGVTIDSAINTNPKDLASRDAIDRNAPNPKLCANFGSSAMVIDQRVFITFNPFNVFVTQADTKPGCVLRPSNVVPLLQQDRKLLTDEDIQGCKNGYNTWGYVGDINNKPQLSCVFQSDEAQNEFLSNPKIGLGEDVYDKDK